MEAPARPSSSVSWPDRFGERALALARELRAQLRTPRDDLAARSARVAAGGGEFAGRRRYRPGDDLRGFDWDLLARGGGEHLRVSQSDGGERWAVCLDRSASMALSSPIARGTERSKLQLAAECALSIAAIGAEAGHPVAVIAAGVEFELRRSADVPRGLAAFSAKGGLEARGDSAWSSSIDREAARRAARWFWIGDGFGEEPSLLRRAGRRRVDALIVLAREEISPSATGRVRWLDPERDQPCDAQVDELAAAAYARRLELHIGAWRTALARTGGRLVVADASNDFEPSVRRMFAPGD